MNRKRILIVAGVAALFIVLAACALSVGAATFLVLRGMTNNTFTSPQNLIEKELVEELEFTDSIRNAGVLITDVVPGSPADQVGLQPGDQIYAINGEFIGAENSLADFIHSYDPGDKIVMEVQSPDEEPRNLAINLGNTPDADSTAYMGITYTTTIGSFYSRDEIPFGLPPSDDFHRNFPYGLEFDFPDNYKWEMPEGFNSEHPDEFHFTLPPDTLEEIEGAIIIHYVVPDSPAETAGLVTGMIVTELNGESIDGAEGFVDSVSTLKPGEKINLTVYHFGFEEAQIIEITLSEHPDQPGKTFLGVSIGEFGRFHEELEEDESGRLIPRNRSNRRPTKDQFPLLPDYQRFPEIFRELGPEEDL